MAFISAAIALAGVGLSAYGSYQSYQGQKQSADAQNRALDIQMEQEKVRQRQMELEATRRKREMIRQAVAARSAALTVATSQGASYGSALQGAYGGISGRTGVNELGVNQNLEFGNQIFALKGQESMAYRDAAAGQSQAAFGSALSQFGQSLTKNIGTFERIGTTFGGFFNPAAQGGLGLATGPTGFVIGGA